MLTERQLFLLQVLVDDYILSAEPIGSRSISKRGDIHLSPATIRNELADLEEMGFLEKTHLSSGRIPSEKGYRFYVDHLLSPILLSDDEMRNIRKAYTERYYEAEKLIETTAQILSDFTSCTAIVLGPELLDTKLKHIQMIRLSDNRAVLIIVTDTGHVENRVVVLPDEVNGSEIERMVNILNERLIGVPLYQLKVRLQQEIHVVLNEHIQHYERMMVEIEHALTLNVPDQIYYGGKNNILSQPEFRDINKVIPLLNVLEKKDIIHGLLRSPKSGIQIKIGKENKLVAIEDCSVITTTYSVDSEHVGTVAVIGPKRMAYPRVVTLLDIISKSLTNNLNSNY
ncbi:heat-inducible transcriptional repressor HrcA [Terrilactibacillus laevilacticus]|uniref:heat-inducible transcriptional repressor HrcA n=1 Tax=Terrilactibacillus laevilacticus TaxID=1380157 RepID=UPI0011470B84|nr:heat-inducible transcriptional repressor HrcA [Terrilactibacillus laevilacticus]